LILLKLLLVILKLLAMLPSNLLQEVFPGNKSLKKASR
jgi:hypothetical protein